MKNTVIVGALMLSFVGAPVAFAQDAATSTRGNRPVRDGVRDGAGAAFCERLSEMSAKMEARHNEASGKVSSRYDEALGNRDARRAERDDRAPPPD